MSTLVGKKAPDFKAKAVIGSKIVADYSLSQFLGKHYVVLFFYPKDFTFVCPTELHAFEKSIKAFEARSVQVIGCSTDSEFSHHAWLQQPKAQGGIQGVSYPLVADINKTIAMDYGVLCGEYGFDEAGALRAEGDLVAYRGLFLIDKQGIVQHQVVNNMALGRSVTETLRMVDALQHVERGGAVCPSDWNAGEPGMVPSHQGTVAYLITN